MEAAPLIGISDQELIKMLKIICEEIICDHFETNWPEENKEQQNRRILEICMEMWKDSSEHGSAMGKINKLLTDFEALKMFMLKGI
jgi:hypothetical protein